MDNASIHRNARVEELCTSFGVHIEYLPPYSPFLNPIEESFHDIKEYMRRHYRLAEDGSYSNFEAFFIQTIREMASGAEARRRAEGHFRHSGYIVRE